MATIMHKGNPIHTNGDLPKAGARAPDFKLTTAELKDVTLADYKGRRKLLNIFPSIDTGVCAASVKKFNEYAKGHNDVTVCMVSADLPFAQSRFCGAEGAKNVVTLSMMRDRHFAKDYGLLITDGPLAGICARAVVVLDENDTVRYTELVPEIAQEPDYAKALAALK